MKLNFKIVFTVLAAVVIFLVLSHYIESPTLNALKIYEAQSIQVIDEKGIERVINHNTIEEVIGFNGTIVEEINMPKIIENWNEKYTILFNDEAFLLRCKVYSISKEEVDVKKYRDLGLNMHEYDNQYFIMLIESNNLFFKQNGYTDFDMAIFVQYNNIRGKPFGSNLVVNLICFHQ